jgi:uncharacterized protein
MSRLILLFSVVVVVYLLIKSYRKNTTTKGPRATEDMVRCAHCGVNFPKSESIRSGGHDFCSVEHRDAYLK